MSELERNKGNLCFASSVEDLQGDMDEFEFSDYLNEKGMLQIGKNVYTVVWYTKSDQDYISFADVELNEEDGTIDFHTIHYNGGGSLQEVLEPYVKKIEGEGYV